jgi:hypothetical protein
MLWDPAIANKILQQTVHNRKPSAAWNAIHLSDWARQPSSDNAEAQNGKRSTISRRTSSACNEPIDLK